MGTIFRTADADENKNRGTFFIKQKTLAKHILIEIIECLYKCKCHEWRTKSTEKRISV